MKNGKPANESKPIGIVLHVKGNKLNYTVGGTRLGHVLAQAPQAQAQPFDQERRSATRARPRRTQRRQQHMQQARARAQHLQ